MITVGFYTNSLYREYAKRLEVSAQKLGLTTDFVELDDRGGWRANASRKPEFIKTMMQAHPGEDVLYLDADCMVRDFPTLLLDLDKRYTAAAYFISADRPRSSTLWMRSGEQSIELLTRWAQLIEDRRPEEPDFVLGEVFRKRAGLSVMALPSTYAWVESYMRRSFGHAVPIIEHFRASDGGRS